MSRTLGWSVSLQKLCLSWLLKACPVLHVMLFNPAEPFLLFLFLQLVSALHNLTRHVVYHGLTKAEDILTLFPENFHQNLKNLLTKIILENM